MRVITLGQIENCHRVALDARISRADVIAHGGGDSLLMWQTDLQSAVDVIDRTPSLRWVHLRDAGVPESLLVACTARGLVLTNGSGAHAMAIAEYVVCALLCLYKRVPALIDNKRRREWRPDVGVEELCGRTIAILGLGAVGHACARLLRPFRIELIGFSRSGSSIPEIGEVHTSAELASVLPRLDALVIAAPLTPATRGIVGKPELMRLPPHAIVVNVGRGEILDEEGLIEALAAGRLAGAVLDVFSEEPLPQGSPLWSMPNVLISPHSVDDTSQTSQRALDLFVDNLDRWISGRPLRNVVNAKLGY